MVWFVNAQWNKSFGGGVCAPTAAVYWLASIHVNRAVWENDTGLCALEANGSVDKKSSLLPQIHRLNAASRVIAAPRANGSGSTTLLELWHNPPVAVEPRINIWAMWHLFKSHCMSLAFKNIRVIQRLWVVLLTWYLNWKVNPGAVSQLTLQLNLKQSVMQREVKQAVCELQQCLHLPSLPTHLRQPRAYISIVWHCFTSVDAFIRSFLSALNRHRAYTDGSGDVYSNKARYHKGKTRFQFYIWIFWWFFHVWTYLWAYV